MPSIGPEELLARLKKGKPIPALLLLGKETYLRDSCRTALIDAFVSEAARTWAISRFSAARGEVQSALEQAQTLPMLSPQQVVFVEEAESIEEFSDKKREDAVQQLEAYLADPQKLVPGNNMPLAGIADAQQRADIAAYLATLK